MQTIGSTGALRRRRARLACLGSLLLLAVSACVYNTTGRSAANVGDIYIPFFRDDTRGQRVPNLGIRVTERIVGEFMRDMDTRVFQGEQERALADKELLGSVLRLSESVLTRSAEETEEEYRVIVTCSIRYVDIASGEVLWQDGNVLGDGNYLLEDGDPGFEAAVEEAVDEIIAKILDKTVRAW